MTAQIPDIVLFQGERFYLIAFDPANPFDPERDLGTKTQMMHTACWRGYSCEYEVLESSEHGFLLRELSSQLPGQILTGMCR
ncbi:MAG: hypothetical protein JO308_09590 [Verrucomicrobia bacterium]|nr:hypothetical protein [Verrucomicrobiota bacterium]